MPARGRDVIIPLSMPVVLAGGVPHHRSRWRDRRPGDLFEGFDHLAQRPAHPNTRRSAGLGVHQPTARLPGNPARRLHRATGPGPGSGPRRAGTSPRRGASPRCCAVVVTPNVTRNGVNPCARTRRESPVMLAKSQVGDMVAVEQGPFCRRVSDALALGCELHCSPAATFNGERVIVAQAVVWPSQT